MKFNFCTLFVFFILFAISSYAEPEGGLQANAEASLDLKIDSIPGDIGEEGRESLKSDDELKLSIANFLEKRQMYILEIQKNEIDKRSDKFSDISLNLRKSLYLFFQCNPLIDTIEAVHSYEQEANPDEEYKKIFVSLPKNLEEVFCFGVNFEFKKGSDYTSNTHPIYTPLNLSELNNNGSQTMSFKNRYFWGFQYEVEFILRRATEEETIESLKSQGSIQE